MANLIGKQLGNYTLTQLLGQGGFAEVYLGEHVYLKTSAAIKVLHAQLSGQDDTESFQREAQTVARLVHPNIIRVLDFGIAEQVPFLVMDYASKGTLRQRYPRGTRLPLTTILPYVQQATSALQYAHDERLIHRDIKPENMLLGQQGDVLLSDFGIALVSQSSRNQNTQDVVGTVAYMSPEQIQGKPRPASDQYSLAIVVYEWLTGERPFNGTFTELCTQHMFATLPPLREKVANISPHVEEVITTALAKDYHQRFGSVKAFANALEQASQGQPPTSVSSPDHPTLLAQPNQPYIAAQSGQHVPYQVRATMPPSAQLQNVTPPAAFMPPNNLRPQGPGAQGQPNNPYAHQAQGAKHQQVQESRPSAWGLTSRQLVAMLIGAPLCAIMGYVVSKTPRSLSTFVFAFSFALVYFFGTKYGPWVGMVTSLAAAIVEYFFIFILYPHLSLYEFCMFYMLLGFVASLAFLRTRGHYRSKPIAL